MARFARGNCKIVGRKFATNAILHERAMNEGLQKNYQRAAITADTNYVVRWTETRQCRRNTNEYE